MFFQLLNDSYFIKIQKIIAKLAAEKYDRIFLSHLKALADS